MRTIVSVPSHDHSLKAENLEGAYICDGCKEQGTDWRYTCRSCNYDMHSFCARPPPFIAHPLTRAEMKLQSSSVVKDTLWCSACERAVSGLRYSCAASRDVLHPCCAHLPKTQAMDSHTLLFYKNLSADPCQCCGQRTRGWAYVSKEYSIHVRCLRKSLINNEIQFKSNSGTLQISQPHKSNRGFTNSGTLPISQPHKSNRGFTNSGTLQISQPHKSNHGFKAFCRNIKLFFRALRAKLFGDPADISELYMSSRSYQ